MINLVSIYAGGILTILLAIFHIGIPKLYRWKEDCSRVSEINRKIFYTDNFAVLLLFFINGFLSLIYAHELSECIGISFGFNIMISVFWFWHAGWQIYYIKGKGTKQYVLIVIFFLLFITYLIPII